MSSEVRKFDTGATRDTDEDKLDFYGFLCPFVLKRFAEYMHVHRKQSDGSLRASDNWKKGIPKEEYVKSKFRHFMETYTKATMGEYDDEMLEILCAELFNTMGLMHEILKIVRPIEQPRSVDSIYRPEVTD